MKKEELNMFFILLNGKKALLVDTIGASRTFNGGGKALSPRENNKNT